MDFRPGDLGTDREKVEMTLGDCGMGCIFNETWLLSWDLFSLWVHKKMTKCLLQCASPSSPLSLPWIVRI